MKQMHEAGILDLKVIADVTGKITGYELRNPILYWSPRYHRTITLPKGMQSDGASGPAEDIISLSFWVHDKLYEEKQWDDGSECTLFQANMVLSDILEQEGRWFRQWSWLAATTVWATIKWITGG